ncbi:MAG: molybdopterin cofactor-binding domain-containing protein [Salinigranum sp.]
MSDAVDTLVRGTLVNVNTGTLDETAVAVDDGEIVALEERPAEREIETGYITPGLIDAHMHVESSMVTLPRYGDAVVPRGVTSIIHDPHEIANVLGSQGVRNVMKDARHTPLKARFTIPSSVPASHLQDAGASVGAERVADLLTEDRAVALGEVMNIPGVLADDEEVHAKIKAARRQGLTVDGHAPRVRGSDLQKVARFLDNDHESIAIEEAREKVKAGMRVYLREGSASKNLADLVDLVDEVDTRRLSLCTDDRDVVDLVEHGGIDYVVQKAIELGVDPVELRRKNLIQPDEFPYQTPVGALYDSGDYETAMDKALDAVDYESLRERQAELREEGRYLGIGVASFTESTGPGFDNSIVRVHPSGSVSVYVGTHSHGQGHGTTYAQIVADELGVDIDDVEVIEGDTESVGTGSGTSASRSMVTGGNAVARSAEKVAEKARRIAAHQLEVTEEDLEREDGEFRVRGAPERSVSILDVAASAYGGSVPEGDELGLEATSFFSAEGQGYAFGTHVAVVEVDPDSGELDVQRYVAVDDCGVQINPMIVEGQVHGAVAQGIGQARYEEAIYDDNGQLLTGSLQDYAVPKAFQIPSIEVDSTETPSPYNPLGVKGVGEGGTIAAPPALVNAVCDALSPLGVEHVDMPLTDETVWRAAADAGQ